MVKIMRYENMLVIPKENESIFTKERKQELTTLEKIGLDAVLKEFIDEYQEAAYGEVYENISDYTRYNKNSVDILDGYYDTYIFDNFAFGSIWCLNNGVVVMDCYDLTKYTGEEKELYNEFADDNNYQEMIERFDYMADFESVLIRLGGF